MSRQGLYFDNMFRAYPLINDTVGLALPDEVIVDFSCAINSEAGFVDGVNKVWLYGVKRTQNHIVFSFACDAAALSDKLLTFHIPADAGEITYAFSELQPISRACSDFQSSSSSTPSDMSSSAYSEPDAYAIWDGFIVIGRLNPLLEAMAVADCMTDPEGYTKVELALVINLQNTAVRLISIANKLPATATTAEGCSDGLEQSYDIITYHRNITGDIRFVNGYSCNITLSASDNSVVFTATTDAVKGQFCGHEELTEIKYKSQLIPGIKFGGDHIIEDNSQLYSGGPTCRDTLKSLNGVGGKRLWILAGRGIALTENQEAYLISINATLSGLAVCYAPGTSVSVSSASLSPTPTCIDNWSLLNFTGTTFKNGDPIPQITDQAAWNSATGPGWCYYDNDAANNAIYGKLYNWFAVTDARGLAPEGFHIPTLAEWQDLIVCLGGSDTGGGIWFAAGAKMKTTGTVVDSNGLWNSPNVATNESGFSVVPAGCRSGGFINLHARGSFWVYDRTTCINFNNGASHVYIGDDAPTVGYSVRLKQGAPTFG